MSIYRTTGSPTISSTTDAEHHRLGTLAVTRTCRSCGKVVTTTHSTYECVKNKRVSEQRRKDAAHNRGEFIKKYNLNVRSAACIQCAHLFGEQHTVDDCRKQRAQRIQEEEQKEVKAVLDWARSLSNYKVVTPIRVLTPIQTITWRRQQERSGPFKIPATPAAGQIHKNPVAKRSTAPRIAPISRGWLA